MFVPVLFRVVMYSYTSLYFTLHWHSIAGIGIGINIQSCWRAGGGGGNCCIRGLSPVRAKPQPETRFWDLEASVQLMCCF